MLWLKPQNDPTREWQAFVIARDVEGEGLAWADVDGDGKPELIAGNFWFKPASDVRREWRKFQFAQGYVGTVVEAADLDNDGRIEIILSEGDAQYFGRKEQGRVAWFKAGSDPRQLWREHVLAGDLVESNKCRLTLSWKSIEDWVLKNSGVFPETPLALRYECVRKLSPMGGRTSR